MKTEDILYDAGSAPTSENQSAPAIPGLDHVTKKGRREETNAHALARLTGILRGRKDWLTAAKITYLTGWDRRYIADVAKLARGEIIACSNGYKLADPTTTTRDDILIAYTTAIRKAIGTEATARAIISYARRKRILTDQRSDDEIAQDVRQKLLHTPNENTTSSTSLLPDPDPQQDLFTNQ